MYLLSENWELRTGRSWEYQKCGTGSLAQRELSAEPTEGSRGGSFVVQGSKADPYTSPYSPRRSE